MGVWDGKKQACLVQCKFPLGNWKPLSARESLAFWRMKRKPPHCQILFALNSSSRQLSTVSRDGQVHVHVGTVLGWSEGLCKICRGGSSKHCFAVCVGGRSRCGAVRLLHTVDWLLSIALTMACGAYVERRSALCTLGVLGRGSDIQGRLLALGAPGCSCFRAVRTSNIDNTPLRAAGVLDHWIALGAMRRKHRSASPCGPLLLRSSTLKSELRRNEKWPTIRSASSRGLWACRVATPAGSYLS